MFEHIEKLVEATNNINVTYRPAYAEGGKPDIGVRKENNDAVMIGDVFWLIAGDIYNKHTNTRISDIHHLAWFNPNGIYVSLRAQASIAGKIVHVHLGKRDVVTISRVGDEGGTLVLAAAE